MPLTLNAEYWYVAGWPADSKRVIVRARTKGDMPEFRSLLSVRNWRRARLRSADRLGRAAPFARRIAAEEITNPLVLENQLKLTMPCRTIKPTAPMTKSSNDEGSGTTAVLPVSTVTLPN